MRAAGPSGRGKQLDANALASPPSGETIGGGQAVPASLYAPPIAGGPAETGSWAPPLRTRKPRSSMPSQARLQLRCGLSGASLRSTRLARMPMELKRTLRPPLTLLGPRKQTRCFAAPRRGSPDGSCGGRSTWIDAGRPVALHECCWSGHGRFPFRPAVGSAEHQGAAKQNHHADDAQSRNGGSSPALHGPTCSGTQEGEGARERLSLRSRRALTQGHPIRVLGMRKGVCLPAATVGTPPRIGNERSRRPLIEPNELEPNELELVKPADDLRVPLGHRARSIPRSEVLPVVLN